MDGNKCINLQDDGYCACDGITECSIDRDNFDNCDNYETWEMVNEERRMDLLME